MRKKWDGLCPARKHGLDYKDQTCDLCMSLAQRFATEAHRGQTYGNDEPYTVHLARVVEVLKRFGFKKDKALLDAGWLHDTVEDTKVRYHDIWERFGVDTAELVEYVTDRPGKNRRERHANTYPALGSKGGRAVALKLADRISNVEYSIEKKDDGKLKMYQKEHPEFIKYLRRSGEHYEMWDHLGGLLGFERPDQDQYSEDDE